MPSHSRCNLASVPFEVSVPMALSTQLTNLSFFANSSP